LFGASLHQIRVEARACHARDFLMLDVANGQRASQQRTSVAYVFCFWGDWARHANSHEKA
jgi:hypothetical protein